jgi:hypothetical protein
MSVSRFSMTTAEDAEERRFQLSTFPRAVTRLKCFRKIAVLESRMSLTRLPRWTAQPRAADHLDERAGHHRHKSGPASNRFRSQFLPADPVSSICRSVKIPPGGCTIRPEIFLRPPVPSQGTRRWRKSCARSARSWRNWHGKRRPQGGRLQRLALRQHPAAAAKGGLGWTNGGSARVSRAGSGVAPEPSVEPFSLGNGFPARRGKRQPGRSRSPAKTQPPQPKAVLVGRWQNK